MRNEPGRAGCRRFPSPRAGLPRPIELQPGDFAGRLPEVQESPERVDLQRIDRAGQRRLPANVSRRVQKSQFTLGRCNGNRTAGEIGNRERRRSAEVTRAFVFALEVITLNAVREAARESCRHRRRGEPADGGRDLLLPEDIRLDRPRTLVQHFNRHKQPIARRARRIGRLGTN